MDPPTARGSIVPRGKRSGEPISEAATTAPLGHASRVKRPMPKRKLKPGRQEQFWVTGTHYYVLGRWGALSAYLPAAGNLYHHAVELMLKYRLLDKYTQKELANPKVFGHALRPLWREFKLIVGDPSLGRRFDSLLRRVDKWEEIRYPAVRSRAKAFQGLVIDIRKAKRKSVIRSDKSIDLYRVNIEEVDELFVALVRACNLNPPVVLRRITWRPAGRACYVRENRHRLK